MLDYSCRRCVWSVSCFSMHDNLHLQRKRSETKNNRNDQPAASMTSKRRVFVDRFPSSLSPLLGLLRRRIRLSREVADDVVRARGYIEKLSYMLSYIEVFCFDKSYFDHIQHGFERELRVDGTCGREIPYVAGKWHGLARHWHTNRTRYCEVSYINNKRHGIGRWWFSNGVIRCETSYADGVRHGIERKWREDGSLESKIRYVHGREVVRSIDYHDGV